VKLPRLLRTTAVRLALRYVLLYALVLGLALIAVLWSTGRYIDTRLEADLERELASLTRQFQPGVAAQLVQALGEYSAVEDRVALLVAEDGTKLAGNLRAWPEDAGIVFDGEVRGAWIDESVIPVELYDDDAWWPVIAREFPGGSRLLLARNIRQDTLLHEITEYLVAGLGVAVLFSLAMGVTMGHAILGRMDTIGRTAGEIMAGDLSQRVPLGDRNDEFDALAGRLNSMLDRIQQLIKGIREVTDNVAHDLRSPLSRLRNHLEVTLLEERSAAEYRQAIGSTIEDVESLIKTFNAMLGIAQVESGNHRTQWGRLDLNQLASDLEELYRPAAGRKGQRFNLVTGPPAEITGSRDLIAQAIGNLLDNAIKYTPEGGNIRLQVVPFDEAVEVVVQDTGAGIPAAEREHVLERFVRLESSRHTTGNGLGLSLVAAVARLHHAELCLEDADPGLRVTLRFPHCREGQT
jgi:signal transduction histidine kinase